MYETPELEADALVRTSAIRIYDDPADFEGMRAAGRLVAEALDMIAPYVVPGVTTQEIDDRIRQFTLDRGALPACLGYKGYMKTVCTSINHVVCHGIPGDRVLKDGDIGFAIQRHVEANRMSVVRDFCGHGIGRLFHDSPNVLHYGRKGEGAVLKPGMFFTVEPMVNLGKPHVKVLSDGWTAVTRDKSLSAQCEHTVGVTEDGVEIFTASPAGLFRPN